MISYQFYIIIGTLFCISPPKKSKEMKADEFNYVWVLSVKLDVENFRQKFFFTHTLHPPVPLNGPSKVQTQCQF